ncbi:MAG: L-serine ammonia-lyase, iron-sulfur-dependent, subunit alpha [Bacillota bacterium]
MSTGCSSHDDCRVEHCQRAALLQLIKEKITPAVGCTEPGIIALAAAAARARIAPEPVHSVKVELSAAVYKNAFAVGVPGVQAPGIELAAALGALFGDARLGLQVLRNCQIADGEVARRFVAENRVSVTWRRNCEGVFVRVVVRGPSRLATAFVVNHHANLSSFDGDRREPPEPEESTISIALRFSRCTFETLLKLVDTFTAEDLSFMEDGLAMNRAIARYGLEVPTGLGIGAALDRPDDDSAAAHAAKLVAAAADVRMAGVNLPVMSVAGSGNQGLMIFLPLEVMADKLEVPREQLYRAIGLATLTSLYVKERLGTLSPLCGCSLAAGIGVAAGLTYLKQGGAEQVEGAMKNMVANLAGLVCDGAKGSCALKMVTSAWVAFLSADLALAGIAVGHGEGLVASTGEATIANLAILGRQGMKTVDEVVLSILTGIEE